MSMSRSFLAIITLLGLALSFSPAAQADWSFYTHPFKSCYNDVSFAVDPADHPHVLMFSDAVYHLYFNGTKWMSELIDNTSWEPEGAIAIDSQGHIHIFYRTVN